MPDLAVPGADTAEDTTTTASSFASLDIGASLGTGVAPAARLWAELPKNVKQLLIKNGVKSASDLASAISGGKLKPKDIAALVGSTGMEPKEMTELMGDLKSAAADAAPSSDVPDGASPEEDADGNGVPDIFEGATASDGIGDSITQSIQSQLVDFWVEHFGTQPTKAAIKNMNAVIAGKATLDQFESWATGQKGYTSGEGDATQGGGLSRLEEDKAGVYYKLWGYEAPPGYLKQFADMNPLEFQYYEMSKAEYSKTQDSRDRRESLAAVRDNVFGIVRQDKNRFGAFDSTANWWATPQKGFLGAKPQTTTTANEPTTAPPPPPPPPADEEDDGKKDGKGNKGNRGGSIYGGNARQGGGKVVRKDGHTTRI